MSYGRWKWNCICCIALLTNIRKIHFISPYLFSNIQKYINRFILCTFNDVVLTIKVTHNSIITKSPLIKGCQSLECADSTGAYEKYQTEKKYKFMYSMWIQNDYHKKVSDHLLWILYLESEWQTCGPILFTTISIAQQAPYKHTIHIIAEKYVLFYFDSWQSWAPTKLSFTRSKKHAFVHDTHGHKSL